MVQLMILAISCGVLLLSVASLWLTFSGFKTLQADVTGDLEAGQVKIEKTLSDNLDQVSVSVKNAEQNTASTLSEYLVKSMAQELSITEEALHES